VVPKWQFCPKSVFLTYQTLRGKTEIRNSRFQAYENIFSFNYQRNKYAKILILKLAGSLKLTFTVTKSKKFAEFNKNTTFYGFRKNIFELLKYSQINGHSSSVICFVNFLLTHFGAKKILTFLELGDDF